MDKKYYDVIFTLLEMLKDQRGEISWKDIVINDKENEIKTLKAELEGKKR